MTTLSGAYNLGYALGVKDFNLPGTQRHIVVLDFGAMYLNAAGTSWFFTLLDGTDQSATAVKAAALDFGQGYWVGTQTDTTSTAAIALGTNNSGGDVNRAAGQAMGTFAAGLDSNLKTYAGQTYGVGANDFEAWGRTLPTYGDAARAWVDGFTVTHGSVPMYNYGSADGCPSATIPSSTSCNGGLQADVIWYVSWGAAPAWPLPEIYNSAGTQAKQWKYLSLYAYTKKTGRMDFIGSMTQYQACNGGCPGTNNSAAAGWSQLYDQLNSDSRIADTTLLSTDIDWHR